MNQYTAVGGVSPTYDLKGNLTSAGTGFTFTYDAENRMLSAANDITYKHDARGWRKSKTLGSTTTIYVTDADNRELVEYDGSNGHVLRRYVYGNGIDEALNQVDVSNTSGSRPRTTLIPDIQGSMIGSLGSGGASVTQTAYKSFGESASTTGSYRYTGRRIDAETNGLYDYRARAYSPLWGRFLQPDPIGLAGGGTFMRMLTMIRSMRPILMGATVLAAMARQHAGPQRTWLRFQRPKVGRISHQSRQTIISTAPQRMWVQPIRQPYKTGLPIIQRQVLIILQHRVVP